MEETSFYTHNRSLRKTAEFQTIQGRAEKPQYANPLEIQPVRLVRPAFPVIVHDS
jgi:hypothetical protein